jgi:hypothetical protein|tara:strand:+ start:1175 stop:1300 length:126 start_codon:yes stop_codon:yes gene_type:complete
MLPAELTRVAYELSQLALLLLAATAIAADACIRVRILGLRY